MEKALNAQSNKRISCVAHSLNLVPAAVIDRKDPDASMFKRAVVDLINKFRHSSAAMNKLKAETGKKLLVPAHTRWNFFYWVAKQLHESRRAVQEISMEHQSEIEFSWAALRIYCDLLQPYALKTDLLQVKPLSFTGKTTFTLLHDSIKPAGFAAELPDLSVSSLAGGAQSNLTNLAPRGETKPVGQTMITL